MTEKKAIEIPFDLDAIFSLTYNFEELKKVLEFIFERLQKGDDYTRLVDTKLVSKMMLLDTYFFYFSAVTDSSEKTPPARRKSQRLR